MRDEAAPSEGARYLLERLAGADDDTSATYRARILLPAAEFVFEARINADGTATLTPRDTVAGPAGASAYLLSLAQALGRGHATRIAQGLPPWPARMQRWRTEK